MKLQIMMTTALFSAIIAVLAQVTIPLPLIPITGQTLAIGLAATILGAKYGTISVAIYLVMGTIGLPVFAQMTGGLGILFGPTGGFLFSFIPVAFIIGAYLEKYGYTIKNAIIANSLGVLLSLFMGTAWLKIIASLTWAAAFSAAFLPFLIVSLLKGFLAAWAGIVVRERLLTNRLLFTQFMDNR